MIFDLSEDVNQRFLIPLLSSSNLSLREMNDGDEKQFDKRFGLELKVGEVEYLDDDDDDAKSV